MAVPDSPEQLRIAERNAFYESLSMEARERFLRVLTDSQERGLDEESSWREAVVAAETAYSTLEPPVGPPFDEDLDQNL